MSPFAAALGIFAFLGMNASFCCSLMPVDTAICHGGREVPKAPEQPGGCHAVMGCVAHRKGRG